MPDAVDKVKLSMMDILKFRLAHHEAKTVKIREAITALKANPDLERLYELLRDSKA